MPWMERRWRPRKPMTREDLLGIANYLTYGRIAVVPVVVLILTWIDDGNLLKLRWNVFWSWIAMILFTLAQFSDVVDGYYARRYGITSSFGKFVDPLADKLLSISVLVMLVELGRVAAWLAVLLIAREVTITAIRSVAASEGIEIAASDWGKKKTLAQAFALGALLIYYPFWGLNPQGVGDLLLGLTVVIAVGSGLHYVWVFFREVLEKQRSVKQGG